MEGLQIYINKCDQWIRRVERAWFQPYDILENEDSSAIIKYEPFQEMSGKEGWQAISSVSIAL